MWQDKMDIVKIEKNGQKVVGKKDHVEKSFWKKIYMKKMVFMQSLIQIYKLEFRGMWNGEVWAKNVSRSVKFFSFNSFLNKNKRVSFCTREVMVVEFLARTHKIWSKWRKSHAFPQGFENSSDARICNCSKLAYSFI